jgi:hypothetical protein
MASSIEEIQTMKLLEKYPYVPTPWRSTVSAPLCALCNKSVFPAEEVIGAGQKYHKLCLKCGESLRECVLTIDDTRSFQSRAIHCSTRATSTNTKRESIVSDAIDVSSVHKEVSRACRRAQQCAIHTHRL